MVDTIQADRAAAAENQARRDQREQDRKANDEQIVKDRADQEKRNLEKMKRDAELRPTPTVEEVQQAMAGHNKDIKQSDNAPLQNERHHVANAAQQIEVGRETPTAKPVEGTDNSGNTIPKQAAKPK